MNSKQPVIETFESRCLFSAAPVLPEMPALRESAVFFFAPAGFAPAGFAPAGFAPAGFGAAPVVIPGVFSFLSPQPQTASVAVTAAPAALSSPIAAPVATAAVAANPPAAVNTTAALPSTAAVAGSSAPSPAGLIASAVADSVTPAAVHAELASLSAAVATPVTADATAITAAAPASASWALAAAAANAELLVVNASILGSDGAAALRQEVGAWTAAFGHFVDHSSLPGVADTLVHALAQDVSMITAEAEHLFAAGMQHTELVEALAAIFAGGAFSAGWLGSREDESAAEVHAPAAAFCDDLIGFGHAMA